MRTPSSRQIIRTLFAHDLRRFFTHPRSLFVVPLVGAGIIADIHYSAIPSLAVVFAISFSTLEAQLTNILAGSPNEFERLSLFALPWETVVLAKNIATMILSLFVIAVVAIVLSYFSPTLPQLDDLVAGVIYVPSVLFTLIAYGNARSVRNIRRDLGWTFRDYAEAIWMPVFLTAFSIPYFVLSELPWGRPLVLVYSAICAYIWYARSVPRTADAIRTRHSLLCETP